MHLRSVASRCPLRVRLCLVVSLVVAAGLLASEAAERLATRPAPGLPALKRAAELLQQEHWAEARAAYDEVRDASTDWNSPQVRQAVQGAVQCSLKLQQWDEALERAQQFAAKTKGSFEEAVGERFLAGLYLTVPHHGTKQGGHFLRGQYSQGVHVGSWNKDRQTAIRHYERARELLVNLKQNLAAARDPDTPARRRMIAAEQIGVDFDLAGTLTAQNQYSHHQYVGRCCAWWWFDVEAEEDSEAVEEADYEEPRWSRGWGLEPEELPTGIPLGSDGRPQFVATPDEYSPKLGAGAKVRFLLEEVQSLDDSEQKNDAARALFRRAMITRSLYGPEAAVQWRHMRMRYDRTGQPIPEGDDAPLPKQTWELGDHEAITLVGGRLRVVELPPEESPLALLEQVEEKYPQSDLVVEAQYARAVYHQTRQQFPTALDEFQSLIARFPEHARVADVRQHVEHLQRPETMIQAGGIHLSGDDAKLHFTYRNTESVQFTALRIDLVKYVQDRIEEKRDYPWYTQNLAWELFQKDTWKGYLGDQVAQWTQSVPRPEGLRVATGSTVAPLPGVGAYVVEATVPGTDSLARVLVLVSDMAMILKSLPGKGMIWVVDARTGQPLADKAVRIYEQWSVYDHTKSKSEAHYALSTPITNADGVVEYARQKKDGGSNVHAIVLGAGGSMAFSFFQRWEQNDPANYGDNGPRHYVVTDRPVYRPGSTVRYRIWLRNRTDRKYAEPSGGQNAFVVIYDTKNNKVQQLSLTADEQGCVSGEFQLGEEPPLGIYRIHVNGSGPDARRLAGGLFRVEEYRKPEFEVKVKPATTQARLGEKIKARIEARYYFGEPVKDAQVTYKVFREPYQHVYFGAGEYDWLYGKGYGRYYYAYPWLPWWGRWGCYLFYDGWWPSHGWGRAWYPGGWYGDEDGWGHYLETGRRHALRDLVAQGTGQIGADGTHDIEIDTTDALQEQPDRDHRYVVEAEVRDASRRTIEGSGSVLATRQAFYAFVETDGGWYNVQDEVFVDVRALTPDDTPVATKGEVIVTRIQYGGADNNAITEEEVKRWNAATDTEGRLSFSLPITAEGHYRISFRTRDAWDQEVQGNTVFWARGPKFDGQVYRFNDLEVIADKRTYKTGDTAHLLINSARSHARVLFSDDVLRSVLRSYRFIDLPGKSQVIDIRIEEKHVPNFFVEATLVRDGRVHTQSRELYVPPVKGLLNVALRTNQPTYQPGEKGTVSVQVTDSAGEPVRGQVTLTAYDESVTYIQDEFGPRPSVFFHGQRRHHQPYAQSSFGYTFHPSGRFQSPEYPSSQPEDWSGTWGIERGGMIIAGDFLRAGEGFGGGAGFEEDRRAGARSRGAMNAVGQLESSESVSKRSDSFSSTIDEAFPSAGPARPGEPAQPGSGTELVEPEMRTYFADTAVWLPDLKLDDRGQATAEITFPQSLTTWRVRGYALTNATQVGDATAKAVTSKDLLVRLQAPRFFVERDEVVLSANVHNYLKTDKQVAAELILPADLFALLGSTEAPLRPDEGGNLHLKATAQVEAGQERRFDWPVRVLKDGMARIAVKAMTDEESDGMRLAFPVLVHGTNKTLASSGSFRVPQTGARPMKLDLPEQIDPEQTRLEITLSPSLAGVMVDALPYLVGYPYGCVEQTMSRFYPTVLVADAVKKMGTSLEEIGQQRKQMNEGDLKNRFDRDCCRSPVYSTAEMEAMIRAGLQRIYALQQSDGGWGWWREDQSSPYQTVYVLQGLHAARKAGVAMDSGVYERGLQFLQNACRSELTKPKNEQQIGDMQTQAYMAFILALENRLQGDALVKWLDALYEKRGELNNYGRSLLALALHQMKKSEEARTLLRNVLQFVERDDDNETAWVRTPESCWWFWWNNDIETNAWALKALVTIEPQNELAPRLVKWLLNNRKNGYYWRSTRDTALTIAAMVDYMQASGEADPDCTVVVSLDGKPMKEVRITKQNFFSFDHRLALYGLQIDPGPHEVVIEKTGQGALYYSAYLSFFTKEDEIKGAGNEIFITRDYFKLVPRTETVRKPARGMIHALAAGQAGSLAQTGRVEHRAGFERVPLTMGDAVASGDQIEVVLNIKAKNTYDYLAFEDFKPAGCEPVELRSGGRWAGGLCANLELRDEKVVFFIGLLEQGEHILRYRMRAESPGLFHALPTNGFAMYAPEVRAISDEMHLRIRD